MNLRNLIEDMKGGATPIDQRGKNGKMQKGRSLHLMKPARLPINGSDHANHSPAASQTSGKKELLPHSASKQKV